MHLSLPICQLEKITLPSIKTTVATLLAAASSCFNIGCFFKKLITVNSHK